MQNHPLLFTGNIYLMMQAWSLLSFTLNRYLQIISKRINSFTEQQALSREKFF